LAEVSEKGVYSAYTRTSEDDGHYKPSQYEIEEALETLNERDDFDRIELLRLEYLYANILYSHSKYGLPNLGKEASESTLFFMQLVALCFKRSDNRKDPDEWQIPQESGTQLNAATNAYHIIQYLNIIPGTQKDGSIDVSKLLDWILRVRKLAKEHAREDITDRQIGKLLSTSHQGTDGIWPREEIRTVVEEIGSTEIISGMETGLYNSKAAEFRSVDSSRERSKASKYRDMADKVMNKTPFVGKMLENMAVRYERDADYWDSNDRINTRLRGW
jgi:hypothetical protein